jgi:aspartate beta-hydroxylase
MQALDRWSAMVQAENAAFRRKTGKIKLALFYAIASLLGVPRRLTKALQGDGWAPFKHDHQLPWLPLLPALKATPLHDPRDHPWTQKVRQAAPQIRAELAKVQASFSLARYDSDLNPKRWTTYYFYLLGRPVREHLAACPRTAELLRQVPHNGFHVCFSAIEPGGSLHPHSGPTNASLVAHLGLDGCTGGRISVAGWSADYRDGEVLVFDDSFVHGVEHAGAQMRYTLMITFWHPELTWLERIFLKQVVRTVR